MPPTLRDYPYVIVRFACHDCPRMGRYRLAVLAERFGADAGLQMVLETISASCPRSVDRHPNRRCKAYYPDIGSDRPPDVPLSGGQRLRIVSGGKE